MKRICNHHERQSTAFTTMFGKKHVAIKEGKIYWHIANFTSDTSKYKTILAFYKAFAILEPYFGGIKFEGTSDADQAQLIIYFTHNEHPTIKQYTPFGEGTLAHAYFHSGYIYFNDAYKWDEMHNPSQSVWSLVKVAVHEFLHLLGLHHSEDEADILYPEAHNDNIINITQDTQEGIRYLYGEYFNKEQLPPQDVTFSRLATNVVQLMENYTFIGLRRLCREMKIDATGNKRLMAERIYNQL